MYFKKCLNACVFNITLYLQIKKDNMKQKIRFLVNMLNSNKPVHHELVILKKGK